MERANQEYVRPEVTEMLPVWRRISDAVAGEYKIKAGEQIYLPMPDPLDDSDENAARYKQYLERATWFDATGLTLEAMVGLIYSKPPIIEIPDNTVNVDDVDGSGITLEQHSRRACEMVSSLGRAGLLTDYPITEGAITVADQRRMTATLCLYRPENIINWRSDSNGLTLLVVCEEYVKEDNGFYRDTGERIRVMRMVDGALVVQNYDDGVEQAPITPRRGNGAPWDRIPFSFIGAINNDADVDKAPLDRFVSLNIAHYRNSADYEESCFMAGQPTLAVKGYTKEFAKETGNTLYLGSRGGIVLPENGDAWLLQANPNQMPKEAMVHKEAQLVALGATLIEQRGAQQTATEVEAKSTRASASLTNIAENVSAAYQTCLEYAAEYTNTSGNVEFMLNTDFRTANMSPQERQQLMAEWLSGGVSWEEYRENMKRAGVATEDDDTVAEKTGGAVPLSANND